LISYIQKTMTHQNKFTKQSLHTIQLTNFPTLIKRKTTFINDQKLSKMKFKKLQLGKISLFFAAFLFLLSIYSCKSCNCPSYSKFFSKKEHVV